MANEHAVIGAGAWLCVRCLCITQLEGFLTQVGAYTHEAELGGEGEAAFTGPDLHYVSPYI